MKIHSSIVLLAIVAQAVTAHSEKLEPISFEKQFVGVTFSPYVKNWEDVKTPAWDSYTVEELQVMLNIVSEKFKTISTYSMGVNGENMNKSWDQTDANGLIPRAAAHINKEKNAESITVIQGVYQNNNVDIQDKEIENAFLAAEEANKIFPGTVTKLTLFNHYVMDQSRGKETVELLQKHKAKAHQLGLKIGTRLHQCEKFGESKSLPEYIKAIAKEADYVICIIFPTPETTLKGVEKAVEEVGKKFLESSKLLKLANSNLEIILGDFGWPSQGKSHNSSPNNIENLRDFWIQMNKWAVIQKIFVIMFEAFDEPWKSDIKDRDTNNPGGKYGAEGHYGWWKRTDNKNITAYVEKVSEFESGGDATPKAVWNILVPQNAQRVELSFY